MTHPEMARMLVAERQRDMLARAERRRFVLFAKRQRNQNRNHIADNAVLPEIPDFVDGTFHKEETVPAARTAA